MIQLVLLAFKKHNQKEKKAIKIGLIKRQPESNRKDHWRRKGELYFKIFGCKSFVSTINIDTLLKTQIKDIEISVISIRRFF